MTIKSPPKISAPQSRHWSKEEYLRLADDGLFAGQRVQLIEGEIIQSPAQSHRHVMALYHLAEVLKEAYEPAHWVRQLVQLDLSDDSQPEPDIAVAEHPFDWYHDHPTTAMLVVEISDSSLRLDKRKAGLYAAAGIPEYWIVDLAAQRVEIYRQPVVDPNHEFGHRYADVRQFAEQETIAPLGKPDATIMVKKIFE
jgi:Uma2 family endonuclease